MLKAKEEASSTTYAFPEPPKPDALEWPGTALGKSNTITRTKSRTAVYDKVIDGKPGRREELFDSIVGYLAGAGKPREIFQHDVIVHGIRVRAFTNSAHLAQFWRENWYGADEWKAATGVEVPPAPRIRVYALGGVESEREAAYYSRASNAVIFFNTSYYGQLKSWVLGAVGRVLADEYGIHSIHGACVERDRKGILYIAPTGTGKSTSSYGLMDTPESRFHSDDWVYVRYALTTRKGEKFSPVSVLTRSGEELKGYRCVGWIQTHPNDDAIIRGLTLESRPIELRRSDVDDSKPLEAYAYISEKVFYLRCNLVESFPLSAYSILQAHLENVPDVLPALLKEQEETLEKSVASLRSAKSEAIRRHFEALDKSKTKEVLARLFAFDNARAMLDITKVFEPNQVFTNPLEPVKLTTVMLLKRNFKEDLVLETLPPEKFMERLLIGETPLGKREIAYNGYRAVDDERESAFVRSIEAESKAKGKALYEAFLENGETPATLQEEFELFKLMYQACTCFDLNTVLERDEKIPDRRSAVETTMKVISRAMEAGKGNLRHTLANYREFIA